MIEHGINALELYDSAPVAVASFAKAMAYIRAAFGTGEDQKEKCSILFDLIREDGWSEIRFQAVLKWFLKNKKFPTWTIADWFEYGIKVYPEDWYIKQCTESYNPLPHLDRYRLADGTIVYKPKDGNDIPILEKLPDWRKE